METGVAAFIEKLASAHRVVILGGLAIIAHGLERTTRDADIWLEPFADPESWANALQQCASVFDGAMPYDLRKHRQVDFARVGDVVARDGVIRIIGLDRPLDVFRCPHNMDIQDFDAVWDRAIRGLGSARVADDVDLLVTKEGTSRQQDIADMFFLEAKVRQRFCERLWQCLLKEAEDMFIRYADHETCRAALRNPDDAVRRLARDVLKELAASGDPFANDILAGNSHVRGDTQDHA